MAKFKKKETIVEYKRWLTEQETTKVLLFLTISNIEKLKSLKSVSNVISALIDKHLN